MDPEDLRKSLLEENAKPEPPPVEPDDFSKAGDLGELMRNEATRISADFVSTADSSERRRLRERYSKLDAWLTELRTFDALPPTEVTAKRDALRAIVQDELRQWRASGAPERARLKQTEADHKHLLEKAKAGAGGASHKRIKDEIEHLLKNFSPSNEAKIEALIDKWRRSGDPNYDPSIKVRLRNARRKKDSSNYAR